MHRVSKGSDCPGGAALGADALRGGRGVGIGTAPGGRAQRRGGGAGAGLESWLEALVKKCEVIKHTNAYSDCIAA